jgi:hypothetical protein
MTLYKNTRKQMSYCKKITVNNTIEEIHFHLKRAAQMYLLYNKNNINKKRDIILHKSVKRVIKYMDKLLEKKRKVLYETIDLYNILNKL